MEQSEINQWLIEKISDLESDLEHTKKSLHEANLELLELKNLPIVEREDFVKPMKTFVYEMASTANIEIRRRGVITDENEWTTVQMNSESKISSEAIEKREVDLVNTPELSDESDGDRSILSLEEEEKKGKNWFSTESPKEIVWGGMGVRDSMAEDDKLCMMTQDDEERPKYPEINIRPRNSSIKEKKEKDSKDSEESGDSKEEKDDTEEEKLDDFGGTDILTSPSKKGFFGNVFGKVKNIFDKDETKKVKPIHKSVFDGMLSELQPHDKEKDD